MSQSSPEPDGETPYHTEISGLHWAPRSGRAPHEVHQLAGLSLKVFGRRQVVDRPVQQRIYRALLRCVVGADIDGADLSTAYDILADDADVGRLIRERSPKVYAVILESSK